MLKLEGCIIYRTSEELNIVLDIFEMLGYKWNAGQQPRGYRSSNPPGCFRVYDDKHFGQTYMNDNAKEAKDLRNMWISLKRRQQ